MNRGSSRTVEEILDIARMHLGLAAQHAEAATWDQVIVDAVCMRLSAGIEALAHLPSATREDLVGDTWPAMWGMRNRIAHGYVLIDPAIVRHTVEVELPEILRLMAERPAE